MTIASFLFALFQAVAAIPTLISAMEQLASLITLWFIQRQTIANLQNISDAAALSARAVTDEDRYAAARSWKLALSGTRTIP